MSTKTKKPTFAKELNDLVNEVTKMEPEEINKELEAIEYLKSLGYIITKKSEGSNKRVAVKANGTLYPKLTDALKAWGFNIDKDWVDVRKHLKDGSYTKKNIDGVEVIFEL